MNSWKSVLAKDSCNVFNAGAENMDKNSVCTAKQCHRGLQEVCSAAALQFIAIARWVAALRDGDLKIGTFDCRTDFFTLTNNPSY
ncbi:hypothetical protein C0J52_23100 [Blattella germanica]|nr:hypothetical protein C0J52_23100 [Blattella germanica]